MNTIEAVNVFEKISDKLKYNSSYVEGGVYKAENLIPLRQAIKVLGELDYLKDAIEDITEGNPIFTTNADEFRVDTRTNERMIKFVRSMYEGLKFVSYVALKTNKEVDDDNIIQILLPEDIKDFDDLEKISSDLKKAVSLPITSERIQGYTEIVTAESGSIIFWVLLGTSTAVRLIGKICYSAAVIRKKQAEAKMFEEHAKTLSLKNETLSDYMSQQKAMMDSIIQYEAEQIAKGNFDSEEPELISRLKMSIKTMQELIDRGTRILPSPKNTDDIKDIFPDYNNLNLIESTMKMLKGNDASDSDE